MATDADFPAKVLNPFVGVAILAAMIAADKSGMGEFFPGRGRLLGVSLGMVLAFIYTSLNMLWHARISTFLGAEILLHGIIVFIAPPDDQYFGVLLLPLALLDYAVFVYGLYFVYRTIRSG